MKVESGKLKVDDYALDVSGDVSLKPMTLDVTVATDGAWQVEPLLTKDISTRLGDPKSVRGAMENGALHVRVVPGFLYALLTALAINAICAVAAGRR